MEINKKTTRDTYKKLLEPNCNECQVSRWTKWRRNKVLQRNKESKGIFI